MHRPVKQDIVKRGTLSCRSKYKNVYLWTINKNHGLQKKNLYQDIMPHVVAFRFIAFGFFNGVKKSTALAVCVTKNFMLKKYMK